MGTTGQRVDGATALAAFCRTLSKFLDRQQVHARQAGLSNELCLALLTIAEDGPLSTATLAELLGRDRVTASGAVDALEKRGLVRRARDDGDRRRWMATVTDRGRGWIAPVTSATLDELASVGPDLAKLLRLVVAQSSSRRRRPQPQPELQTWRSAGLI